jgi:hypothetical protein
MSVEAFISTLPIVIVGIAAATSLISFRYNNGSLLKKMSVLWLFNFCIDLTGHITRHLNIKNIWLYNIYYWVLFISVAYLYSKKIKNIYILKSIQLFYILFPLLVISQCIFFGIKDLQTIVIVAGGIFMIVLSTAYFRQLYMSDENKKITRDPWFWFSFGFIIYFGAAVPFLGMLNYLNNYYRGFTRIYYIYFLNTLAILQNILLIVGFLCPKNYFRKSR